MFLSSISFSKLSTFRECGYKYRLKYHDRPKINEVNESAFQFGSYIHEIYEKGYEAKSLDELIILSENLRQKYTFDENYNRKVKVCLENFLKLNSTISKTLDAEKRFNLEIGEDMALNGIIDRVVQSPLGNLLILDYKTSKTEKKKTDLYYDEQLLGYAYAAHKLYEKPLSSIQVALYYPLSNNIVGPVKYSSAQVALFLQALKKDCWKIRKLRKDEFRPNVNQYCSWCSYKPMCPAHVDNLTANKLLQEAISLNRQ